MNRATAVALAAALVVTAPTAIAATVTVDFSGHIISTAQLPFPAAQLGTAFSVGGAFAGRYIYRDDLPGFAPANTARTMVYDGFNELSVTVGGLSYASTFAHAQIADNANLGQFDFVDIQEGVYNGPASDMIGPLVNGFKMYGLALVFTDPTNAAIADASLLKAAPDLTKFTNSFASFEFYNDTLARGIAMYGRIEVASTTVSDLPEPASLPIVVIAASWFWLTRGHRPRLPA